MCMHHEFSRTHLPLKNNGRGASWQKPCILFNLCQGVFYKLELWVARHCRSMWMLFNEAVAAAHPHVFLHDNCIGRVSPWPLVFLWSNAIAQASKRRPSQLLYVQVPFNMVTNLLVKKWMMTWLIRWSNELWKPWIWILSLRNCKRYATQRQQQRWQ